MKTFSFYVRLVLLVFTGILTYSWFLNSDKPDIPAKKPNDWAFIQRAFPYGEINHAAYSEAIVQAELMKKKYANNENRASWDFAGPLNIGGRVTAVALHPTDQQTFYIGAASGGIFKTEDGGLSFSAIFDEQPSLSIGDVVLAPSNPEIIYVGTGEANPGGGSVAYDGLGVFRSNDGGATWVDLGLHESGSIGKMVVHPENPDICYVAAMGRMFSTNSERGIFKTTDGGQNWEKVLYLNDSTGAVDIAVNPENPEILYAAMWERTRTPDRRHYGGQSCGIFKTTDGGTNWTELTAGLPSGSDVGRIGISISPSNPDILYAIYADEVGYFAGIFKTSNAGETWTQTNDGSLGSMYSSYGWWFGRIRVDPVNPQMAYAIGFDLYKTTNGGNSWSNIGWSVHVDQHDLYAHPMNPNFVVLGNDGGVYISQNAGNSWTFLVNLPITQFYTVDVDYQFPERLYGGTQDNGTNRTMTGNLNDWTNIYGGDGFYVLVNPQNNQYVYAEYQYGGLGRSTNGGYSFSGATNGISGSDRFNWSSPLVFDPNNPQTLYYGGNRLYKSTNHAANWTAISNDLSNGPGQYNQTYGTITTISVSKLNDQVIYAGTDDANVWVTQNGGSNWTKVSDELPERWVTRVAADPFDEATAFVTFSGYRYDEYLPHIFRTTNFGQTWQDISGDLPEAPINDIIVDPTLDSALYIATDVGVFASWNLGQNWGLLGLGLPNVPVCDLTFHDELRMLTAATYGRSMFKIDVDQFVDVVEMSVPKATLHISPNPANDFIEIKPDKPLSFFRYHIKNANGVIIHSGSHCSGAFLRVNISQLPDGMYFLHVMSENEMMVSKFIKK